MAADTDRPANVQAYLDKHRISSLFETLTSHLVKDLPADPLGFLILKLQGIKKKAPASSSKPAASTGLRKPTATSSSTTGARKPVSSASSVASSRSTSSRPATSSSGIAKPSSAKTRPSSVKQSSTAAPDTKASTRAPGGSRIPRSPVKPVKSGVAGKPSAPPTTAPPTGAARTRKPTSATTTRATTTSSAATKGKPDHDSKLTKPSSSSKPSSVPTSNKERVTKTTPSLPAPVAPPPPSVSGVSDDEMSDDETQLVDYDSDDEHDQQYHDQDKEEEFDINALVLKLKRSKGPNKRHRDHLSVANGLLHTSPSSGYQTSEDEEEEEGGLDVAESATVLELEEGITLGHQARIIAKKLPRPDPVINLNVMVCGRCGHIMNQQQDSASQVDGSHVTFPQWDDTTSTLTSKPCDRSDQTSTSTSWHGVGQVPIVSCMEPSTDETSDLMVPDAVPAAQQPRHEEDQEQLEEEEEVMIGGEDQL